MDPILDWKIYRGTKKLGAAPTGSLEPPALLDEPLTLKPETSGIAKVLVLVLIATFWNGICSVFVVHVVRQWMNGQTPWFIFLFLTPFVLVGIGLIAGVLHALLALLNPRPVLTLDRSGPALGETLELEWRLDGRTDRLRSLTITLESIEETKYRRGTDTVTDTETLVKLPVVEFAHGSDFRHRACRGAERITIPADQMHSFAAPHNRVQWSFKVNGRIPFWPDINDTFPLIVLPGPGTTGAFP